MSKNVEGIDFAALFAAGVASVASRHGMSEKTAEAFVDGICKQAARGRYNFEDVDDQDTFWSRNKSWLIPAIVGSLAFYAGADAERHGRRDRGYLSNAGHRIFDRIKNLFGVNYDPLTRSLMETPEVPEERKILGPGDFPNVNPLKHEDVLSKKWIV